MDLSLPPHLNQRVGWTVHPNDSTSGPGYYVLYWMHNALRGHQNPALDVAICWARQNGLPLLVYHALAEDYPFASDRTHAFILQGNRDVQRELRDRGVEAYFHLESQGRRGPHLRDLTRKAAVLVTESMPVQPLVGWIERIVSRTSTPIASVDAACLVPLGSVSGEACEDLRAFRETTHSIYEEQVGKDYPEQEVDCEMYDGQLPFEPLDLQDVSISELIRDCSVDHSISPVIGTPGGTRAGYERWASFREAQLEQYQGLVDEPESTGGVSRMSAYLHFGMVSPFRMAREAAADAAEDFLEKLLVWREFSFHYCQSHLDVIDSFEALPGWAIDTLKQHSKDPRTCNFSWETLSRGKTGYASWDQCQQSLLRDGELHPKLRQFWGKSLLPWISTPNRAMRLTMDLNHRYALDGRDPSSYTGVLWCFGQFDKPDSETKPCFGRVPSYPLGDSQSRECESFSEIDCLGDDSLNSDSMSSGSGSVELGTADFGSAKPSVAVIGAGLAGLTAARTLSDHGYRVTVFDKSRGVGGRLATRRVDSSRSGLNGDLFFDHGAQYFTARNSRFCRFVQSWIQQGLAQPWLGRIVELETGGKIIKEKQATPRYVGVPTMNTIAKHLAEGLNVTLQTQIASLQYDDQDETWTITDCEDADQGTFDFVIVNCPPRQAASMIANSVDTESGSDSGLSAAIHQPLVSMISGAVMRPTWATMICATGLDDLDFDGAFINNAALSWIARDSSKPGRDDLGTIAKNASAWMLHASQEWTTDHLDHDPDKIQALMLEAFVEAVGKAPEEVLYTKAHRWLYAIPKEPLAPECLWDAASGIAVCGDWCGGPRVEGAFLSGMAAAGSVMRHLTIDRSFAKADTVQS